MYIDARTIEDYIKLEEDLSEKIDNISEIIFEKFVKRCMDKDVISVDKKPFDYSAFVKSKKKFFKIIDAVYDDQYLYLIIDCYYKRIGWIYSIFTAIMTFPISMFNISNNNDLNLEIDKEWIKMCNKASIYYCEHCIYYLELKLHSKKKNWFRKRDEKALEHYKNKLDEFPDYDDRIDLWTKILKKISISDKPDPEISL